MMKICKNPFKLKNKLIILWSSISFSLFACPVTLLLLDNFESGFSIENWFVLIILLLVFAIPTVVTIYPLVNELFTCFEESGIKKFTAFGKKELDWSLINKIETNGFQLIIRSKNKKTTLNLLLYANPNEVLKFVEDHTGLTHVSVNSFNGK